MTLSSLLNPESYPEPNPELAPLRRTATLQTGETLATFAARVLPDRPLDTALDELKRWNLHIFLGRRPVGEILGSDIVFIEPPAAT